MTVFRPLLCVFFAGIVVTYAAATTWRCRDQAMIAASRVLEAPRRVVPRAAKLKAARASVEGSGGFLFGDEVKAYGFTSEVQTVRYEPGATPSEGTLVFGLADKSERRLERVESEDAYVARALIFGETYPYSAGNDLPVLSLKKVGAVGEATYQVIMHPDVYDSQLAWAMLSADILPIDPAWLIKALGDRVPDRLAYFRQMIRWVFDPIRMIARDHKHYDAALRFTDMPIAIHDLGTHVLLTRDSTDSHDSVALLRDPSHSDIHAIVRSNLRREAFIEFSVTYQPLTADGRPIGEVQTMPRVTSSSAQFIGDELAVENYEFYRLNRFSAVLAAVRWAFISGATFPAPAKPEAVLSPDFIRVTAAGVEPIAKPPEG